MLLRPYVPVSLRPHALMSVPLCLCPYVWRPFVCALMSVPLCLCPYVWRPFVCALMSGLVVHTLE